MRRPVNQATGETEGPRFPVVVNHDTGEAAMVVPWLDGLPFMESLGALAVWWTRRTEVEGLPPCDERERVPDGLKSYVGQSLVVHDLVLFPSLTHTAVGALAMLDLELVDRGVRTCVSAGGTNVLRTLALAYRTHRLPLACKVTETVSQRDPGWSVQWLSAPDLAR